MAKIYTSLREKYKDSDEDHLCFRITFWDEFMNRVEEPYIAQIHCESGVITYYTADEGQRLQKIYEEHVPQEIIEETMWDKFKKLFW